MHMMDTCIVLFSQVTSARSGVSTRGTPTGSSTEFSTQIKDSGKACSVSVFTWLNDTVR
jgi:hypothetical protein